MIAALSNAINWIIVIKWQFRAEKIVSKFQTKDNTLFLRKEKSYKVFLFCLVRVFAKIVTNTNEGRIFYKNKTVGQIKI